MNAQKLCEITTHMSTLIDEYGNSGSDESFFDLAQLVKHDVDLLKIDDIYKLRTLIAYTPKEPA